MSIIKLWYQDLSKHTQTVLLKEFGNQGGLTKEAVMEYIRRGRLRIIPGVGSQTAKEICDSVNLYPNYPDPLSKFQPQAPSWIDELSKPVRDSLLHQFKRDRTAITKEAVKEMLIRGDYIYNVGEKKRKELRDYLGVTHDDGGKDPITKIYVLKKLWIDESENSIDKAMGYEDVGFTTKKNRAESLVKKAGVRKGDGWPIPNGEEVPVMKFVELRSY